MQENKKLPQSEVEANRSGALVLGTVGATCCVGSVAILGSLSLPVSVVAATGVSIGIAVQRLINQKRKE
ncbi:MAG: hypothetical protein ACXAD7_16150 [Candidatus Kariarchaeaceae archaeon]